MRQVMPHRNNMCLRRSRRKYFLGWIAAFPTSAAILQHKFRGRKSRHCNNIIRYKGLRATGPRNPQTPDMTAMQAAQDSLSVSGRLA